MKFKFLFRDAPIKILMEVGSKEKTYMSNVAKEVDCTYSHAVKMSKLLVKEGLFKEGMEGRINYVTLTEKGKALYEAFLKLLEDRDA